MNWQVALRRIRREANLDGGGGGGNAALLDPANSLPASEGKRGSCT